MNKKRFLAITGSAVIAAGGGYYLLSDKNNFITNDIKTAAKGPIPLMTDEREILYMASLAPSGHNTQLTMMYLADSNLLYDMIHQNFTNNCEVIRSIGLSNNGLFRFESLTD
jgi:hypothetical protein